MDIDTEAEFFASGRRLAQQAHRQTALLRAVQPLSGPARIAALARHVWASGSDADTFLNAPHLLLDGLTPLEAATTLAGAQRAENVLWRIVFGITV